MSATVRTRPSGRFVGQSVAAPRGSPPAHRARALRRRRGRARHAARRVRAQRRRPRPHHASRRRRRAARSTGVVAVLTAADLNPRAGSMRPHAPIAEDGPCAPLRLLADGDVRFVGDPIALVVAESRYIAEDACELVEVDYRAAGRRRRHERRGSTTSTSCTRSSARNVGDGRRRSRSRPELEAIFDSAPRTSCRRTFVQHRYSTVPMETRGILVSTSRRPASWTSGSRPRTRTRAEPTIARITGVPEHQVRVAHGRRRRRLRAEDASSRARSSRSCSPRYHLGRRSSGSRTAARTSSPSTHARGRRRATVTLALDADGHILGAYVDHLEDVGAYPSARPVAPAVRRRCSSPARTRIPKSVRCRTRRVHQHVRAGRVPRPVDDRDRRARADDRRRGARAWASTRSSCAAATSCRPPSCRTRCRPACRSTR